MKLRAFGFRVSTYGAVGLLCAGVYASTLLILEQWLPSWIANPTAFLVASVAGSFGHSRYTFRRETGGNHFAKRWVAAQYLLNIAVCTLLPLVLPLSTQQGIRLLILVFTPTILNAFVWSQAALFSKHKRSFKSQPLLHADDLGLSHETNNAICQLTKQGKLDGASLLVNAPATKEGAALWAQVETMNPDAVLCLHLCLTEGPPGADNHSVSAIVNSKGFLHYSFGRWLLFSLLPNTLALKKKIRQQLRTEIKAQIQLYKLLTGKSGIRLDGHQHIHLVPIILDELIKLAKAENIQWIRSTREPLPSGLSIGYWACAIRDSGFLKWFVLQILNILAEKKLEAKNIATNQLFSGILFTGQMSLIPLRACWKELSSHPTVLNKTPSILLAHPSSPPQIDLCKSGFSLSHSFAISKKRSIEWESLNKFKSNKMK